MGVPDGLINRIAVAAASMWLALSAFAQDVPFKYAGMAEASAAARLDDDHFIVAEDECNTLLVFKRGQRNPVGQPVHLAQFLGTKDKASDIEGAARVGDVIYWISSHSTTKTGQVREWRQRFFATRVEPTSPPTVKPIDAPFSDLVQAMIAEPKLAQLKLASAAKKPPEEHDGLNIEGLAEWKDHGVLIGLRNPLRDGRRAVLVPLENPAATVRGQPPKFGRPILLDLNKRGVRSIDRADGRYLIVAGPTDDKGAFALYRWSGKEGDKPALLPVSIPVGLAPEALVMLPGGKEVMLLSDDGVGDGIKCGNPAKTSQDFRGVTIKLQ